MSADATGNRGLSRRSILGGIGAAAATGAVLIGTGQAASAAPARGPGGQRGGIERLFAEYMETKSAHDPDRTVAFFDPANTTYSDATLGWKFDRNGLLEVFRQFMPNWPAEARSYATEIVGGASGAIVRFTNTPEEFGAEIRGIAVVDIRDGKFVRWVDYWDGRHFGVAATESQRTPAEGFPSTFGEETVGEHAAPQLRDLSTQLNAALAAGDANAAGALFAADAVVEDLTLHTAVTGRQSIVGYLSRATDSLPYGRGAAVRHTVGARWGGGYEWQNPGNSVPRGVNALTVDGDGRITRLTALWDGSLVPAERLTRSAALTIES
jgi:ketosteroid isomerase-like protein